LKITEKVEEKPEDYMRGLDIVENEEMEAYDKQTKQTPWPQSAIELYRPSKRRLSTKLLLTFADRGCRVVSATDRHRSILGF
jgi:hypothetical protein